MIVKKWTNMGTVAPSQWMGEVEDGRTFYIRYRFGLLSVTITREPKTDVFTDPSYLLMELTCGGSLDGYMTDEEMQGLTQGYLFWGEER